MQKLLNTRTPLSTAKHSFQRTPNPLRRPSRIDHLPSSRGTRPRQGRKLLTKVRAKAVEFETKIFEKETATMPDSTEDIVRGGRDKFPLVKEAFAHVKQVGIIGWGSQAPAQAQNLRDTFREVSLKTKVVIGLRRESPSNEEARTCGFKESDGTLGEFYDVISRSDFVILLISDAAQSKLYPRILAAMKPGATLGLSHGFLLGVMKNDGVDFRSDINVILVAPKVRLM